MRAFPNLADLAAYDDLHMKEALGQAGCDSGGMDADRRQAMEAKQLWQ